MPEVVLFQFAIAFAVVAHHDDSAFDSADGVSDCNGQVGVSCGHFMSDAFELFTCLEVLVVFVEAVPVSCFPVDSVDSVIDASGFAFVCEEDVVVVGLELEMVSESRDGVSCQQFEFWQGIDEDVCGFSAWETFLVERHGQERVVEREDCAAEVSRFIERENCFCAAVFKIHFDECVSHAIEECVFRAPCFA